MGKLRSEVNRLSRNDKHLQKNGAVIQDQHHEVLTCEKTETNLRIVFDASIMTKKKIKSLNECLHRSPVILEDICGFLLRFRSHKVELVADVEKPFLQVGLQRDDRNVTSTESHQSSIRYDIHSISVGHKNKKLSN